MPQYSLSVRLSDSSTFAVNVDADPTVFTVADLKKAVQAGEAAAAAAAAAGGNGGTSGAAAGGTPPDLQKLVYKGRILKDADTMEQYGEGARARLAYPRSARVRARGRASNRRPPPPVRRHRERAHAAPGQVAPGGGGGLAGGRAGG